MLYKIRLTGNRSIFGETFKVTYLAIFQNEKSCWILILVEEEEEKVGWSSAIQ